MHFWRVEESNFLSAAFTSSSDGSKLNYVGDLIATPFLPVAFKKFLREKFVGIGA